MTEGLLVENAISKLEELRSFLADFHDGKQKNLAEAYDLTPSVVSGWLKPENEGAGIPASMLEIIRLTRQVADLSKELAQARVGRVVQMKSGYAIVRFADSSAPGVVLCKGVADLETANGIVAGMTKLTDPTPASSKKDS